MFKICLLLFFVVLPQAQTLIHDFGNKKLYDYDFFFETPKNQWLDLDSSKQRESFNSFIQKELVFYESSLLGLEYSPDVFAKLEERKKQLLVNHYYEREVALPLVEPFYKEAAKNNLKRELFVYHVLVGYEGCALEGSFPDKKEALKTALIIKEKIKSSFLEKKDSLNVFKTVALSFSDDPSVVNNKGELGWVAWGRSIDEFQLPLFLLKKGGLSDPILTPYGFHVVFISKERPSSASFYNKEILNDFTNKACLQSLNFDILRKTSAAHDSTLLSSGSFLINHSFVDSFLFSLNKHIEKTNLRGGKKTYLDFFEKNSNEGVLFVFKNKGFGVGWLKNKLKKTPSTRIPLLKTKDAFNKLLSDFVLQEEVLSLSKNKKIFSFPLVFADYEKHKKNIINKAYLDFLSSSVLTPDSSVVLDFYVRGIKDSSFFSKEERLVKSLNFSSRAKADSVYSLLKEGVLFDSFLIPPSQSNKTKTIKKGSLGPLGEAAFSLDFNGFSSVVLNTDKSFSLIKLVGFKKPSPLSLNSVYSEIEKTIVKKEKKEKKKNIYKNLKNKFSFTFNYEGLK